MSRYSFTVSPITSAVAASQAKYEAAGMYVQMRLKVDFFRTGPGFTNRRLDIANKGGYQIQVYQDGTIYEVQVDSSSQGLLSGGSDLLSELPANGNDVVLWIAANTSGVAIAVGLPDGTVVHEGTNALDGGWSAGAGTGNVNISPEAGDTPFELDSYARFSAARTGDARFAKPLADDADVLGVYYFSEGSGTTVADSDASGGTALTLTDGAWVAGAGWEAVDPDPPEFTSLSIDNPNLTYEVGVLLDPIIVTKLDQYDDPFTGSPPADVTVTSLSLPVTVTGTLTENFVGAVATFDNLTPVGGGGGDPGPSPAPGDGEGGPVPRGRADLERNARRMEMRGQLDKVMKILAKHAPKRP